MAERDPEFWSAFDAFAKAARDAAKTPLEKATFETRPGVTFMDVELFGGDRVIVIDEQRLREEHRNGRIREFAEAMFGNTRARRGGWDPDPLWRPVDLEREVNHRLNTFLDDYLSVELRDFIRREAKKRFAKLGEGEYDDGDGRHVRAMNQITTALLGEQWKKVARG